MFKPHHLIPMACAALLLSTDIRAEVNSPAARMAESQIAAGFCGLKLYRSMEVGSSDAQVDDSSFLFSTDSQLCTVTLRVKGHGNVLFQFPASDNREIRCFQSKRPCSNSLAKLLRFKSLNTDMAGYRHKERNQEPERLPGAAP